MYTCQQSCSRKTLGAFSRLDSNIGTQSECVRCKTPNASVLPKRFHDRNANQPSILLPGKSQEVEDLQPVLQCRTVGRTCQSTCCKHTIARCSAGWKTTMSEGVADWSSMSQHIWNTSDISAQSSGWLIWLQIDHARQQTTGRCAGFWDLGKTLRPWGWIVVVRSQ